MSRPVLSSEEVRCRGDELYRHTIQVAVETSENIGKLVSIDVETGRYEVGDDRSLAAPRRLHALNPGTAIYTLRIGHNATYSFGLREVQMR